MHLVCVKKCIGLFLEYTFQRNVRVVLEKHTTNFYITLLLSSSFWPSLKTIIIAFVSLGQIIYNFANEKYFFPKIYRKVDILSCLI